MILILKVKPKIQILVSARGFSWCSSLAPYLRFCLAQSNMMDSISETDAFDPLEPDPECGSPTSGTSRFGNLAIAFWSYTLIMFLIAFGCAVIGPASPRLIEMAVCRQYFEDHDPSAISPGRDIPEELCKSEEVQRSFTFMLTVLSTCTNLIGQ